MRIRKAEVARIEVHLDKAKELLLAELTARGITPARGFEEWVVASLAELHVLVRTDSHGLIREPKGEAK